MDFECYLCQTIFSNHNDTIRHLKSIHGVIENVKIIKCIVHQNTCNNTFRSYSGLRNHIKECLKLKNTRVIQCSD